MARPWCSAGVISMTASVAIGRKAASPRAMGSWAAITRQMPWRTDAAGAEFHLFGTRFHQRHQLLNVAHRYCGMHDHHIGRGAHQPDGRKIAQRVVRRFLQRRYDGQRGIGDDGQRIAIGRGPRAEFGAQHTARARAVFHDDRLPECFAQTRADQPRHHVVAAARGEGRDDAQRAGRVVLRMSSKRGTGEHCSSKPAKGATGRKARIIAQVISAASRTLFISELRIMKSRASFASLAMRFRLS